MIPNPTLNIWARTRDSLYGLYEKRAANAAPELDCHVQAADIYTRFHQEGDTVLDAGGGSGYFYWSLKRRDLSIHYHLLDYTADFLDIGRRALSAEKPRPAFIHNSIQQASGSYKAVFCLNTLFCLPDYRQGLEALLNATEKMILIRTPLSEENLIRYETDKYLDPGAENLKSYFNIWRIEEVNAFVRDCGFTVSNPVDLRTMDQGEMSAGKLFPWRWLLGVKNCTTAQAVSQK